MFKTFKPFNRYAEPGLSKVEGFESLRNEEDAGRSGPSS